MISAEYNWQSETLRRPPSRVKRQNYLYLISLINNNRPFFLRQQMYSCSPEALVELSVSRQQGAEVVATGQRNREDWVPLGPPLLQGTQAWEDSDWGTLDHGSITNEAGGTILTPAMQPVTGSKTYNVGSKRVNIIMWNSGSWFPFYQNFAARWQKARLDVRSAWNNITGRMYWRSGFIIDFPSSSVVVSGILTQLRATLIKVLELLGLT